MDSDPRQRFHAMIRTLLCRINNPLDETYMERWQFTVTPLKSCVGALEEMRRDAIGVNKAIENTDIIHSPWSFDDKGTYDNRLSVYRAVNEMAKSGRLTNGPPDHLAKVVAFLRRNAEGAPECVRRRSACNCLASWAPLTALPSHFWPDIRYQMDLRNIHHNHTWDTSAMQCPACSGRLVFEGTIGPDGRPRLHVQRQGEKRGELTIILPCGHVIGQDCLNTLRGSMNHSLCPKCSGSLKYRCGHFYEDLPAPESLQDLRSLRFSAPPSKCDCCLWKEFREFWDTGFGELLRESEQSLDLLRRHIDTKQLGAVQERDLLRHHLAMIGGMRCLLMVSDRILQAGKDTEEIHSTWATESPLAKWVALLSPP